MLPMDLLSPLFARFALSARVFYTGALCGIVGMGLGFFFGTTMNE